MRRLSRPDVFATRDGSGRLVLCVEQDGAAVEVRVQDAPDLARRIAEAADRTPVPQAPPYLRLVVDNRPRFSPPAA